MAAILALLSSLLWGSADFLGGTLSKRHRAFAVTGLSQIFGLLVGLIAMAVTGAYLDQHLQSMDSLSLARLRESLVS